MGDFAEKNGIMNGIDLIVPVPLYPSKLREKRYNHAELLARELSAKYNIPCNAKGLKKIRWTVSQSKLDRKKRSENVRGALLAVDKKAFYGRGILLVDDVFTTGATLNECAKTLVEAGATSVSSFTLARPYSQLLT